MAGSVNAQLARSICVACALAGCAPRPSLVGASIYQVVERPLLGASTEAAIDVPIVAGREALLRLFVRADEPHTFHARVGDLTTSASLRDSTEPALDSTLDLELVPTGDLELELDGVRTTLPLSVVEVAPLPITIVPIVVNGRAPEVTSRLLTSLREELVALYPIPGASLTVAPAFAWDGTLAADGAGWPELVAALADRGGYTYGLVAPAAAYEAYCGASCVTGLSTQPEAPSDPRVSVGLAYGDAAITFAHELGHAHGRHHAPCDVPDPDPSYPYTDGQIGAWGWRDGALVDPRGIVRDVMSYCEPAFISDYTYRALFDWDRASSSADHDHAVAFDHLPGALVHDGARWRARGP